MTAPTRVVGRWLPLVLAAMWGGAGCNTFDDVPAFACQDARCEDADDVLDTGSPTDTATDTDDSDDTDDTDVPCPSTACTIGERECTSDGDAVVCVGDAQGCGAWSAPMACPTGCSGGDCVGCVDGDADGYGEDCALGADCNDDDGFIWPGAPERCDGLDNDCDAATPIDEPWLEQLGQMCSVGQGVCEARGSTECLPDGSDTACSATPGTSTGMERCNDTLDSDCDGDPDNVPTTGGNLGDVCVRDFDSGTIRCLSSGLEGGCCLAPGSEICDGQDNDCNGQSDENNVCNDCQDDRFSPNHSGTVATAPTGNPTLQGLVVCPDNGGDWFQAGTAPLEGDVRLVHAMGANAVGQPYADLAVSIYCGSTLCESYVNTETVAFDSGQCTGCTSGAIVVVGVQVLTGTPNPDSGTPYRLTLGLAAP